MYHEYEGELFTFSGITGRKSNRRTVFTVQSSTVEKTEAAVEKLSVLLSLKTPDFDGDTRSAIKDQGSRQH